MTLIYTIDSINSIRTSNSFFPANYPYFLTVIFSKLMGCVQQRQTRPQPKTSPVIKEVQSPQNKAYLEQHQHVQSGSNGSKQNEASPPQKEVSRKQNIDLGRYSLRVKQSSYRTPSIHNYIYQPLIVFNPHSGSSDSGERDVIDKMQDPMYIPSLRDIHNKLLLTKQ